MTQLRNVIISFLLILAACSSDGSPMAGNWVEDTGSDAIGMTLSFDGHSDEFWAHLAPREDGSHDHAHGTYSYDEETKTVTVKAKLMGDGKADTWTGKVDGQTLELGAADTKLKFRQGGSPAGH